LVQDSSRISLERAPADLDGRPVGGAWLSPGGGQRVSGGLAAVRSFEYQQRAAKPFAGGFDCGVPATWDGAADDHLHHGRSAAPRIGRARVYCVASLPGAVWIEVH